MPPPHHRDLHETPQRADAPMRTLGRLLGLLRGRGRRIAWLVPGQVVVAAAGLVWPWILGRATDLVAASGGAVRSSAAAATSNACRAASGDPAAARAFVASANASEGMPSRRAASAVSGGAFGSFGLSGAPAHNRASGGPSFSAR